MKTLTTCAAIVALAAATAAPPVVAAPLAEQAETAPQALSAPERKFPAPRQLKGYKKAKAWAKSSKVRSIRHRESRNNYRINTGNGYYGAYQFAYGTWRAMGGHRYAPTADLAPKHIQDYVAWRLFTEAGWAPWGG